MYWLNNEIFGRVDLKPFTTTYYKHSSKVVCMFVCVVALDDTMGGVKS